MSNFQILVIMKENTGIQKVLTARFIVDALLEDYIKVVAKIEKTTEQEIKTRIASRANELLKDFQKNNPVK